MSASLVLFAVASTASGQWVNTFTGNSFNNMTSSYLDTVILGNQRMQQLRFQQQQQASRREAERRDEGKRADEARPSKPEPARQPISATDFKAGPRIMPALLTRALPDTSRSKVEQQFLKTLDGYEATARKYNVAYALAVVIGTALEIRDGRSIGDAEGEQMALAINDALALDPRFAQAPARHKQELYERCVLSAVLMAAMMKVSDEKSNAFGRELASQVLRSFGFADGAGAVE